jgi:hypothetical protein
LTPYNVPVTPDVWFLQYVPLVHTCQGVRTAGSESEEGDRKRTHHEETPAAAAAGGTRRCSMPHKYFATSPHRPGRNVVVQGADSVQLGGGAWREGREGLGAPCNAAVQRGLAGGRRTSRATTRATHRTLALPTLRLYSPFLRSCLHSPPPRRSSHSSRRCRTESCRCCWSEAPTLQIKRTEVCR